MPVDPTALHLLHDRLGEQLSALTTGDQWLAFLSSSRQFHRYSPQNQLLLAAQGAVGHVAGYRTWQHIPAVDGRRCQVRKGEQGLMILAPLTLTRRDIDDATGEEMTVATFTRFKPVKVFHQAQLVSPPVLAEPPMPKLLTGDNRYQHVWAAVQSHLEDLGYDVELVNRSPVDMWNGRTDFTASHVVVSDHLEPPARLKTLIHEWAHIGLRHDEGLPGRRDLQEVEAESVAYLVCAAVGVDSADYSVPYLAGWAGGDRELLDATAQRVLATAADMITTLEAELSIDLTPDLLTLGNDRGVANLTTATEEPSAPPLPMTTPLEPAPLLGACAGELRTLMAGLVGEGERQRLLDALDNLDTQLATVVDLCNCAGFGPERTARFLLHEQHVEADDVLQAIVRDELDHHPQAPNVSPSERRDLATAIRRIIDEVSPPGPAIAPDHERTGTSGGLARLTASDRDLLAHMDLTQPDHLSEAVRVLAAAGLSDRDAADVLAEFAVPADQITPALNRPQYNPATGTHESLWPPDQPAPTDPPPSVHPGDPAHQHGEEIDDVATPFAPPAAVVLRVAATGNADRLVQLSDAFGLEPGQAIRLWADTGVAVDVVARSAIAARAGDTRAAAADLNAHWPGDPVDWNQAMTPPAVGPAPSTAQSILRQWADMRPGGTSVTAPEMA